MAEKIHVLYVDDERSLLEIGKKFLERSGDFTVFTAESASEALELAKEHHIDVIISDYQIPTMNGIDFLKAVRNTNPDIPFIFFSGKGSKEIVIEAFKSGVDLYLEKRGEPKNLFKDLQHTVTEIVTLKNAERALRESEERYRSLFEGVPIGLYRTTPSGQILDINPALVHLLGYPNREMLITVSVPDLYMNPGERTQWLDRMEREGVVRDFEVQFRTYDGTIIWVQDTGEAVRDDSGQVIYYNGNVEDITERKRAEAALQLKDFAIVSSMNAIAIADLSGNLTYVNPAFLSIWGYENGEDVLGQSVLSFWMEPEEAQQVVDGLQAYGNWSGELTGKRKDGTPSQVQLLANTVRDASGTPIAMMGSFVDITERTRAERKLRDIIAKNPMSIQIVDKDGFTLNVNSAHTSLFGAIPPSDFSIFNDVQLKQKGFGELIERIKNGEVVHFPDTYYNAHDSVSECPDVPVWVRTVVFPLNDNYGKPEQFVLMHDNITKRKQAEEALRASEQRYRNVVEDQTELICRFSPDRRLTFINEAYCNYFRLNREESIGKRHSVVLPLDDAQQMKDHLTALTPDNPVAAISHRIVMPFSEIRWQRWSDRVIFDTEGNVIEYQSVGRDITQLKETEIQLENYKVTLEQRVLDRTSELSETNVKLKKEIEERKKIQKKLTLSANEKDLLLREVHHRVKNNLQLIIGLIDMTKSRAHEPAVLSTLTDIMTKVQTMGSIHTQLYASKRFDKINMKRQVHDLVDMISGFYDHDHLDITTNIDCAEIYLPVDQAIPCALALNEIISNIHKHAFSGRRNGLVDISSSKKDDMLRFVIRDNGVGLPSGFDIERSNRLGMKLMRTLVEQQLHGTVQITSKAGTEVMIEFPINQEEPDYGTGTGS